MNVWINDYTDVAGKDIGTLLSLTPNLHLILAFRGHDPNPLHSIGVTCPKCRQPIQGRNVFPAPKDTRVLGCNCVAVLFSQAAFNADWIITHWSEWGRLKRNAETQLAKGGN